MSKTLAHRARTMKFIRLLPVLTLLVRAQDPYNERPENAGSRTFDIKHVQLELSFDLRARSIAGTTTLSIVPLTSKVRELAFDSSQLAIEEVTVDGSPAHFRTTDEQLYVDIDSPYRDSKLMNLVIKYHAQPKRGLFFVLPDKNHPSRPSQMWAQGDTAGGNNRFWFPERDIPNDKATVAILITVPAGWEAVSIGRLVGVSDNSAADTRTFHWEQDKPMSSYLISFVAGEFDRREEKWKVPLLYYVPRGRSGDVLRTFGRTKSMLDFFSSQIALYPWAKYSQAAVDTFNGGMENTSATTVGADMLLDAARFEDDRPATDADIAHEMAHQWFGDLVTCSDWRQAWLNEGFATYFEELWEEHSEGRDYFDWAEERAQRDLISQLSNSTVVPVDGSDETSAYKLINDKGAWILQMIRGNLGEARFSRAIRYYTKEFSYKNVTTSDFVGAIAASTGENLSWIFDQYVYRPGNPKFNVAWDYDSTKRKAHISLRQTQSGNGVSSVFHVPLDIEVLGSLQPITFHVWVSKQSEDFYLSVPDRPHTVVLDPRDILLKSVTFTKPDLEWIWQLNKAPTLPSRSEAAVALGSFNTPASVDALARVATADAFFGIRLDAIGSLQKMATEATRTPLMETLRDRDLRVRKAGCLAVGKLAANSETLARLIDLAEKDPSYSVRQSALRAVVSIRPANVIELVVPFLDSEFADQRLRPTAIAALAHLGDERALPRILSFTHDSNDRVRRTALQALGELGHHQQVILDRLLDALHDDDRLDRMTAIAVLAKRKETAARAPLERLLQTEELPGVTNAIRAALQSIPTDSSRE